MTTATISSKSQITLPVAACRQAGLKPHDRVLVEVRDGAIIIRSAPDLMALKGILGKALPKDVEDERTGRALAAGLKKAA